MPQVAPLRSDDPKRVGRYRLTGRVPGLPGSSRAYLGRATDGDRVTLTMLGTDRTPDGAARDRFTAEARAARRVAPFCVARILDAGVEGGHAYLVTEFVAGPLLSETVDRVRAAHGRRTRSAGHRNGNWPGRGPPGRARARRVRAGLRGARYRGTARDRLRHHPALRQCDPGRGHARLGADGPVRRQRRESVRCRAGLAAGVAARHRGELHRARAVRPARCPAGSRPADRPRKSAGRRAGGRIQAGGQGRHARASRAGRRGGPAAGCRTAAAVQDRRHGRRRHGLRAGYRGGRARPAGRQLESRACRQSGLS